MITSVVSTRVQTYDKIHAVFFGFSSLERVVQCVSTIVQSQSDQTVYWSNTALFIPDVVSEGYQRGFNEVLNATPFVPNSLTIIITFASYGYVYLVHGPKVSEPPWDHEEPIREPTIRCQKGTIFVGLAVAAN